MPGGGVLPYAVASAYEQIVEQLRDAADLGDVGFLQASEPIASRFIVDPRNPQRVNLDAYLHLQQWRVRNGAVSIVVRARENISRASPHTLYNSNVHLDYYDASGPGLRHLHSIHFDFTGEEPQHPLFHAQLCPETAEVSPEMREALELPLEPVLQRSTCFREARIPTADMTFASVLLCLAADHLQDKPEIFTEFRRNVQLIQDKMPLPSSARTAKSIENCAGRHMRSSHWFAHM